MVGPRARTILVVDDNGPVCQLMGALLCNAGYTVLQASSGFDALGVFATHQQEIDLLVTDVDMPGMDGVELACQIRANCPLLPVVLVSGRFAEHLNRPEGCFLIEKPFHMSTLVGIVNRALPPFRPPGRASRKN